MAKPTCALFTDEPLFVTDVPDEELLDQLGGHANDVRTPGSQGLRGVLPRSANGRHFMQMTGMTPEEMLIYVNKQLDKFGTGKTTSIPTP